MGSSSYYVWILFLTFPSLAPIFLPQGAARTTLVPVGSSAFRTAPFFFASVDDVDDFGSLWSSGLLKNNEQRHQK